MLLFFVSSYISSYNIATIVCYHAYVINIKKRSIITTQMLQIQVFSVEQVNKPCIGLIQENLIENSVQDCLPYILKPYGPC